MTLQVTTGQKTVTVYKVLNFPTAFCLMCSPTEVTSSTFTTHLYLLGIAYSDAIYRTSIFVYAIYRRW